MISLCGLSEADQLKITTFLRQKLQLNNTKISEILRISDVELGRGIKLKEEDPSELLSDTEADIIEGTYFHLYQILKLLIQDKQGWYLYYNTEVCKNKFTY